MHACSRFRSGPTASSSSARPRAPATARRPSLVRRADGQTLQLTRLLYLVLEAIDGTRGTSEEIAEHASTRFGRLVSADNVRTLIDSQLLPLGLLRLADGSQPEVRKVDPLLGMRFRYTVTDPERTRRLTAPFAALFNPLIVVPVTAAFLASVLVGADGQGPGLGHA